MNRMTQDLLNAIEFHRNYYKETREYPRAVDQLIEEMSELTKVLLKERRGRDVQDHIKEEIADVEICLELLYDLKSLEYEKDIVPLVNAKANRMIKKLSQGIE